MRSKNPHQPGDLVTTYLDGFGDGGVSHDWDRGIGFIIYVAYNEVGVLWSGRNAPKKIEWMHYAYALRS